MLPVRNQAKEPIGQRAGQERLLKDCTLVWAIALGVGRIGWSPASFGWSPSAGLQEIEPPTKCNLAEGVADSTIFCESLEWAEITR